MDNASDPLRRKIEEYYGIFKGEYLSPEEIDGLIREETEKLLRNKLNKILLQNEQGA
ncbi:hypothetical protein [Pyrococcus kukulkanii]|uniref:hypothetical protein n=1 Tax=Pyrococcus kukulkanii TaxID=1609559 RepID=UPI00137AFE9E|nr:hypothetical protein [Pyrococcus kukulkanii]